MTDDATLLPCPFCGAAAKNHHSRYGMHVIGCTVESCAATTIPTTNEAAAIAAWNRRAIAQPELSAEEGKV